MFDIGINALLSRLSITPFFFRLLNKHPDFKLLLVRAARRVGALDSLIKLKHRLQPNSTDTTPLYEPLLFRNKGIIASQAVRLASPKKRLAFVSPLPPLRSGISDYSATLLPLLANHYDIDVIVDQDQVSDQWTANHCGIHSASWFKDNSSLFSRVIYHFGNSQYHEYMLELINIVPGIVVLHDFFLGHLLAKHYSASFNHRTYQCHGYKAIAKQDTTEQIVWSYPMNLLVLQNALNVIVHSTQSKHLGVQFYGASQANDWPVIPLLRAPPKPRDKTASRLKLEIPPNAFVICSFGMTGETKLNHRLLNAWASSKLSQNKLCYLIFVGENDHGNYGTELLSSLSEHDAGKRAFITHWVDNDTYETYLSAADVGVQLRTRSRGETSAAVLDCMNHGLATIVNAHGSMFYLPNNAVYKLTDSFSDKELTLALETLWRDTTYRSELINNALQLLSTDHNPNACSNLYISTIESTYCALQAQLDLDNFNLSLMQFNDVSPTPLNIDTGNTHIHPLPVKEKQLLIDVSAIVVEDLKTGIQRVVRAQLKVLLQNPPIGYRVEPVFLANINNHWHYQYAHAWTLAFLDLPASNFEPQYNPALLRKGDILFCADLNAGLVVAADSESYYQHLISSGVKVYFQVFDLLPILHPDWFPDELIPTHLAWAGIVAKSTGAICISQSVANEFDAWNEESPRQAGIDHHCSHYFHLGSDIRTTSPSTGMPKNATDLLTQINNSPSFLMVGTIEPRKGHEQTLAAFSTLWQQDVQINLIIVGKAGWLVDELVVLIKSHPQFNHHLFWLDGVSDEFLDKLYSTCSCLIAASKAEGFGLPLIEASHYHLPIIARDIPVFKEVAGNYASYFSGDNPDSLALCIENWIENFHLGEVTESKNMPRLSWRESTEMLVSKMGLKLSH